MRLTLHFAIYVLIGTCSILSFILVSLTFSRILQHDHLVEDDDDLQQKSGRVVLMNMLQREQQEMQHHGNLPSNILLQHAGASVAVLEGTTTSITSKIDSESPSATYKQRWQERKAAAGTDADIGDLQYTTTSDSIRGTSSAGKEKKDNLLLNVPFYIYEEFDWLGESSNTTIGDYTFLKWTHSTPKERNHPIKHDEDQKFYLSALKHPMRVHRPEDAKLFLAPMLTTYIGLEQVYGSNHTRVCNNGICGRDLLVQLETILETSKWFRRSNGSDHVVLLTSSAWLLSPFNTKQFENIKRCNVVQFGENQYDYMAKDRIRFNTFYVGTKCDTIPYSKKTDDITLIAKLWKQNKMQTGKSRKKKDLANFQDRRNICDWTKNSNTFKKSNHSMTVCGSGEQCPNLANARLGFHPRGDTRSANRLFDTLLSGTVPIFTLDLQFTAHQSFIDWKKLVFFIRMGKDTKETLFRQKLEVILGDEEKIKEKTIQVMANRDLFDWDTIVPFDVYMYMFQARLWPETRVPVDSSKYSALILPPQLSPPSPTNVIATN